MQSTFDSDGLLSLVHMLHNSEWKRADCNAECFSLYISIQVLDISGNTLVIADFVHVMCMCGAFKRK